MTLTANHKVSMSNHRHNLSTTARTTKIKTIVLMFLLVLSLKILYYPLDRRQLWGWWGWLMRLCLLRRVNALSATRLSLPLVGMEVPEPVMEVSVARTCICSL